MVFKYKQLINLDIHGEHLKIYKHKLNIKIEKRELESIK